MTLIPMLIFRMMAATKKITQIIMMMIQTMKVHVTLMMLMMMMMLLLLLLLLMMMMMKMMKMMMIKRKVIPKCTFLDVVLTKMDTMTKIMAHFMNNVLRTSLHVHVNEQCPRKSRHASASGLLRTLHWLPVKARIQYLSLSDLLHPYCPSRTLRALNISLLTVPRFSLQTFGERSFSVFGPTVWNSLRLSLRKTQCFTTSKKKPKTQLFQIHLC